MMLKQENCPLSTSIMLIGNKVDLLKCSSDDDDDDDDDDDLPAEMTSTTERRDVTAFAQVRGVRLAVRVRSSSSSSSLFFDNNRCMVHSSLKLVAEQESMSQLLLLNLPGSFTPLGSIKFID